MKKEEAGPGKNGLGRIMEYWSAEKELFTKVRKEADSDSELSSVAEGGVVVSVLVGVQVVGAGGAGLN